jgi:hypothetical protein
MDEIAGRTLVEALRAATEEAAREHRPSTVAVASVLRARVAGPDDPQAALAAALEYHPVDPAGCGRHGRLDAGAPAQRCDCARSRGAVDAHVLPLLADALAHAPRPLVAALFADLLWTARYGDNPHEWAQRAVDAYLASVFDEFGHVLEISEGLQRALAIAAEIDDRPRRAAVITALVGLANRSVDSHERSSGVSLSIIELLAGQSAGDRPPELDALLDRALARYRDDPWLLESALDIKARLVEPGDRVQVRVAQVEAFMPLARSGAGTLRYAHYEHAIALAERHELTELAEQLRNEVDGPRDPATVFVDRIVADDDLTVALARFGACLPTEGDSAAGDAAAVDAAEEQRRALFGALTVEILGRMRERYGSVSGAGHWFECALIEPAVAARIAHAIELYELGDFDASASVLAPRLERVLRLIEIAGTLYEPSRRYLRALLADSTSTAATTEDAALLVHAACHLRLLRPVDVVRQTEKS